MSLTQTPQVPRPGMFATVRNRRGVVAAVEPFDGEGGRLHLVHVEYKDDGFPSEEQLLWELEVRPALLEPTALPRSSNTDPMRHDDFDALVRAARWGAAAPYLVPDAASWRHHQPFSSPFHGAVQVEDFQLVPLLKALRMPRVNLLIADDVGLGKTVEAGLILSELLLRRRIQRVLIITPASLRLQWRDEMWQKFSLPFDVVDRDETDALRRRLGLDANPWRTHGRIITSYHYLRQSDVLDQFIAASRTPEGSPHLPWDLLIVDECHNLMPSYFGNDSDLCRMLRLIAPQFEHRLFLSATPHNGHTLCYTGLLEILDPVRFSQQNELLDAARERVDQIVVRRLKREINARTNPPRFCTRNAPQGLALNLSAKETALSNAFDAFRTRIRKVIAQGEGGKRRAGSFAVEILGKRLLSCPVAFAESWRRAKEGLAERAEAADAEVLAAKKAVEADSGDDRELQARESTAVGVVGAWLKNVASDLQAEIAAIDATVGGLGLADPTKDAVDLTPRSDARIDALLTLIDERLRPAGRWADDERIIVFTEYKTTLDYVTRRLRERYEPDRVLTLFGGMDELERSLVRDAFNDPEHGVRILVATDAAAEGLNLQRTARYLLHFDCPWNPSRLEQRNGRVDRHGQARDVTIFHFFSEHDHDLAFLAHVIRKADEIRDDLGSANDLFDEAAHRRLVAGDDAADVTATLNAAVSKVKGASASIGGDRSVGSAETGEAAEKQLAALAAELDLHPASLRDTLEGAMAAVSGRPQLECSDTSGTCRVMNPGLPGWIEVIDDSLRRPSRDGQRGPLVRLAFDEKPFLAQVGQRHVFSPRLDAVLLHLSHPMLQRALSTLSRRRYPGTGEEAARWTVRMGGVPPGAEALIRLTVEELAVNDLRETFHHWVRTFEFPVNDDDIGEPLPHRPAATLERGAPTTDAAKIELAREVAENVEPVLKRFVSAHAQRLTQALRDELGRQVKVQTRTEHERYQSRQGEVSALISKTTVDRLEREIAQLKASRMQGLLFDEEAQLEVIDRSIEEKAKEVARRQQHHGEVLEQLKRERERIVEFLLPRRHTMSAPAQVFPVSLEICLPGGAS